MSAAPWLVALGGALGSLARYALVLWTAPISQALPWGTIAVNIAGSFVIGFFGTLTSPAARYAASEPTRLFVMVGFCGGFTTFSSFSLQTFDLLLAGYWMSGLLNVIISLVACLAGVTLGHSLATWLNGRAVPDADSAIDDVS